LQIDFQIEFQLSGEHSDPLTNFVTHAVLAKGQFLHVGTSGGAPNTHLVAEKLPLEIWKKANRVLRILNKGGNDNVPYITHSEATNGGQ